MSSDCANRIDQWQEEGFEERLKTADEELALAGLKKLLEIDGDWTPHQDGTSLYIRPTMIATDAHLGVHASHSYLFYIILSPVGAYYAEGLKLLRTSLRMRRAAS